MPVFRLIAFTFPQSPSLQPGHITPPLTCPTNALASATPFPAQTPRFSGQTQPSDSLSPKPPIQGEATLSTQPPPLATSPPPLASLPRPPPPPRRPVYMQLLASLLTQHGEEHIWAGGTSETVPTFGNLRAGAGANIAFGQIRIQTGPTSNSCSSHPAGQQQ